MLSVHPIPILNDNYVWHVTDGNSALVVDPGDGDAVIEHLNGQDLVAILITHHHWDHTQGVNKLKTAYPNAHVYGPQSGRFQDIDTGLSDSDSIDIPALKLKFNIIEVPGHTLDHILYYNDDWAFCGDTVFSVGCGRMFEGDPKTYQTSLEKISKLKPSLQLFPTHEYTLANLAFAQHILPQDAELISWKEKVLQLRQAGLPSLPVVLADELKRNPFLRCAETNLQQRLSQLSKQTIHDKIDAFAILRQLKDKF